MNRILKARLRMGVLLFVAFAILHGQAYGQGTQTDAVIRMATDKYDQSQTLHEQGEVFESEAALDESVRLVEKGWENFDAIEKVSRGGVKNLSGSLKNHVVNTGFDGKLASDYAFQSTPEQIDAMISAVEGAHNQWLNDGQCKKRIIVLYAHGGLVSEDAGAETHRRWWLDNSIYPINFVWHSGLLESFHSKSERQRLHDQTNRGALTIPSKLVEAAEKKIMRPLWDEMKTNAAMASRPLSQQEQPDWSKIGSIQKDLPGASLLVSRLRLYVEKYPDTQIHVMGHSAGSIFSIGLLERLQEYKIPVESVTYLAPAMRVDEFDRFLLPKLRSHFVKQITVYNLPEIYENSEVSAIKGIGYQGSILKLVSQAIESPGLGNLVVVPILGMQKFFLEPINIFSTMTLNETLRQNDGLLVLSDPDNKNAESAAVTHSGFDDEPRTLDSTAKRILKAQELRASYFDYCEKAP
jgi:pimeloyl-ACP methyl ester carboxylesterase